MIIKLMELLITYHQVQLQYSLQIDPEVHLQWLELEDQQEEDQQEELEESSKN
jgi:hypothetical protein